MEHPFLMFLDHTQRRSTTPHPGCFTPEEGDPVSIVVEAGWAPLGLSGRVRKIMSRPGFDPRTAQPVASRYTD